MQQYLFSTCNRFHFVVHFLLRSRNLSESPVLFPIISMVKFAKIWVLVENSTHIERHWKLSNETLWITPKMLLSTFRWVSKFSCFISFVNKWIMPLWKRWHGLNLFWPVFLRVVRFVFSSWFGTFAFHYLRDGSAKVALDNVSLYSIQLLPPHFCFSINRIVLQLLNYKLENVPDI